MRIIYKIAKNEWRYLFFSPIAWFVLVVFFVQSAILYAEAVYGTANWQEIMMKNSPNYKGEGGLTWGMFVKSGLFTTSVRNLYLYIPILTMGLISRDALSGSAKLLHSSPVGLRQIVLGKYMGIMLFNLMLVGTLVFFMLIGAFTIEQVDYGLLLSAALGFYLLLCAYSAIGLFMSSLSSYQVISALGTFIVIFFLTYIGSLWQRYDLIRDLTYFLSLQNRVYKLLGGLIVTRDLIYFLVVSGMFVGFTLIRLRSERESRAWYVKWGRYLTVMAVSLVIGYCSSRPVLTAWFDTTATKRNTISKQLQELIKGMGDSTLEVTLYANLLGEGLEQGMPEARNDQYLALWEPIIRFKPNIQFRYEYYYDNDAIATDSGLYKIYPPGFSLEKIAGIKAESLDDDLSRYKSPEQMHQLIDLRSEGYRLVMQLKYRGRKEFLRTFPDPEFWPDAGNFAAAFKRLLEPEKIPAVYFVAGELERSIRKTGQREFDFHSAAKISRGSLVNTGYDVDTVNLSLQDVPANCTALVLADPRMELSEVVQQKTRNYIDAGGNMFFMGKPGKQYVLNPVLQQLGVQLMNGQLVQPSFDETPDKVNPYITSESSKLYKGLEQVMKSLTPGRDTIRTLMPGVTAISHRQDSVFKARVLLATSPGKTWLKAGELIIDSTLPPLSPAEGDIRENSFVTGLQLTRKINDKDQRIVVTSDADYASNLRLGAVFNAGFLMSVYSWLGHNEFPVYMTKIPAEDKLLRLSESAAKKQQIVLKWVLPGLLLLAGTILLIRRKRK
ncbi:Gldg family protein [Pseudobacter ginsenosidimutans]|uniref:ABC-2 type transport system permease protein n=2 Tax=Pseudobacter ginsenosidimutans TaxID=661488 RepID=A0A4Q7MG63_9BACT|nr:Gldg family protein [Pseudobacter ginsenosidimutans]RZS67144.1 ABC-2 type transport system permease protein [Pseudobacter ginsenosidimutans]